MLGARPLSPFGIWGMIARKRVRRALHELYPRMAEDCNAGGLGAYTKDVAIDVGFMEETHGRGDEILPM
jgi:hypothetical protein